MTIKEILDFKIIDLDNYSLTLSNLLGAIFVIVITKLALSLLTKLFSKYASNSQRMDKGRWHSVLLIIRYFVWVISITFALEIFGIKITILIAGSAALFVGIGLGLQQIFNDFVSGMILLFEGSIEVGDVIEVDGIVGRVREIRLRASELTTRDDIVMIVPNHKFINENVINWSHNEEKTRFNIKVSVAHGSDTELVKNVLLDCTKKNSEISNYPKAFVRFCDFGESSLNFELYFWCDETFRIENIKSDLRFVIDKMFRENQITIPFPQRDLHIKSGLIVK